MHRPNKHHPELPPRQKQRNKLIAKVRAAVERPYAVIKENYGLRRLRFFNFERNHVLIVLACTPTTCVAQQAHWQHHARSACA